MSEQKSNKLFWLLCVVLCVALCTSSSPLTSVAVLSSQIRNLCKEDVPQQLSHEVARLISNGVEKLQCKRDFQGILKFAEQNLRRMYRTAGKVRLSVTFQNEAESNEAADHTRAAADDDVFWNRFRAENDQALREVLLLDQTTEGWQQVAQKDGVTVEKRFLPAGTFVSGDDATRGSKHACVKSSSVLNAHPDSVFQLFADNARVRQYNEHCATAVDVRILPEIANTDEPIPSTERSGETSVATNWLSGLARSWSKISYAVTPPYTPFKSRDFLSVVHYTKFSNGTSVIINRPAYLASHPPTEPHVRATVLVAGNIIRPYGEDGNRTHLTLIAQVNPGGGADTPAAAWLMNKLCAVGPPQFMRRLEAAARMDKQSAPIAVAAVPDLPVFSVQRETTQLLSDTSQWFLNTARGVVDDVKRRDMHGQVQEVLKKTSAAAEVFGKTLLEKWEENLPALEARQIKLLLDAARKVKRLSTRVAAMASSLVDRLEGEMNSRYSVSHLKAHMTTAADVAALDGVEGVHRRGAADVRVTGQDSACAESGELGRDYHSTVQNTVPSAEEVTASVAITEDVGDASPA